MIEDWIEGLEPD